MCGSNWLSASLAVSVSVKHSRLPVAVSFCLWIFNANCTEALKVYSIANRKSDLYFINAQIPIVG